MKYYAWETNLKLRSKLFIGEKRNLRIKTTLKVFLRGI